jgi:hypothetical protein
MIRKWYFGISVVLLTMVIVAAAYAEPLRSAKVGDRMGSLITGLRKVDDGPLGSCAFGNGVVSVTDYTVPGRAPDDDNASYQAFTIEDHIVALVAYDEGDLSTPVAVYADIDGNGLVTHAWPAEEAPSLCAIVKNLHYRP